MYEGGAGTPPVHLVTISQTVPQTQNFDLPAPGHVNVTVVDENDDAVPPVGFTNVCVPCFQVMSMVLVRAVGRRLVSAAPSAARIATTGIVIAGDPVGAATVGLSKPATLLYRTTPRARATSAFRLFS